MNKRFNSLGVYLTPLRRDCVWSHLVSFRFNRNDPVSQTLAWDIRHIFYSLFESVRPVSKKNKRFICYGVEFDAGYLEEFKLLLTDFSRNCYITGNYSVVVLAIFWDVVCCLVSDLNPNM